VTHDASSFTTLLDRHRPILIDGGLATQCEAMGCNIDGDLWSAVLLQSNPRAIVDAHRAYLNAGAEIIATASYQASRSGFMAAGLSAADADGLIASSVALAEQARAVWSGTPRRFGVHRTVQCDRGRVAGVSPRPARAAGQE